MFKKTADTPPEGITGIVALLGVNPSIGTTNVCPGMIKAGAPPVPFPVSKTSVGVIG